MIAQALRVGMRVPIDGEQHVPARAFGLGEHPLRHLIDRVLLHAHIAIGAVRVADAGVKQAQEIVALGGSGDGRSRIARAVFLPYGDGGRDAVNIFDIGLFHALEELARVGGERFHIAALAFGVDGVESERGLTGTGDTGDDRHLVMGNGKRNIFEIVDPRPADPDEIFH